MGMHWVKLRGTSRKSLVSYRREKRIGFLIMLQITVPWILALFLLLQAGSGLGQTIEINGRILDRMSGFPVSNVNIQVLGTREGTVTDPQGRFSLFVKGLPVTLVFTCVGYHPMQLSMKKQPEKSLELFLNPAVKTLQEIDIRANRFEYLFRDDRYSILDYEIMDTSLLLLVFRSRLKNASLIMMTMNGDTLAAAPVPEPNPASLFTDCLDNVHYISSRGNAFQCQYDSSLNTIQCPFRTSSDTLMRLVKPFLFRAGERLYFEEYLPDRSGKHYGYILPGGKKKYLRSIREDNHAGNIWNEIRFLHQWNQSLYNTRKSLVPTADPETKVPVRPTQSALEYNPIATGLDIQFNIRAFHSENHTKMIRLSDTTLALFDFVNGKVDVLTPEGAAVSRSDISFHKETDQNLVAGLLGVFIPLHDWKWTGKVLADPMKGEAYTIYEKNGMVRLRRINLATGEEGREVMLLFPFPEKIRILNSHVFYLVKEVYADFPRRRLVSQAL